MDGESRRRGGAASACGCRPRASELDGLLDESGWRGVFARNLGGLLRLGLLLTGDSRRAEAALIASMDLLDDGPLDDGQTRVDRVERAVVGCSVLLARDIQEPDGDGYADLAPELKPLLRLDAGARCSYVLRILVGYPLCECARLLGLEAGEVAQLVASAAADTACWRIVRSVEVG
jgi:hypothetical protein